MNLDAIFFGAHPDDAELSCGGTIAKMVSSKKKIGIVDLTAGEMGTRGSKDTRLEELKKASKILHISVRENLGIKDGWIENSKANQLKVIKIIRKYKPGIIFMPYQNDRHPDHSNASRLIRESAFYSGLIKIKTALSGKDQQAFRPKKNFYFMQTYTFEPSFIVDISEHFGIKMRAVRCYSSQFYDPDSKEPKTFISDKKFIEYLEARAAFYGFQIGVKYGEPFFCEDNLKLDIGSIFNC
jgi:bacillithiol biosynthesis deacetylase BshB1